MVLENADIYMVSEMDPILCAAFPASFAYRPGGPDDSLSGKSNDATVLAMPFCGSTLPAVV